MPYTIPNRCLPRYYANVQLQMISGLQFHDTYFEPAPEVTEALRRLNLKVSIAHILIHVFRQKTGFSHVQLYLFSIFRSRGCSTPASSVCPPPTLWPSTARSFPRPAGPSGTRFGRVAPRQKPRTHPIAHSGITQITENKQNHV